MSDLPTFVKRLIASRRNDAYGAGEEAGERWAQERAEFKQLANLSDIFPRGVGAEAYPVNYVGSIILWGRSAGPEPSDDIVEAVAEFWRSHVKCTELSAEFASGFTFAAVQTFREATVLAGWRLRKSRVPASA